jgi:DNA-directed RNA polymerase, mitochondrial
LNEKNKELKQQIEIEQSTLNYSLEKYDNDFKTTIRQGRVGDTKEATLIIKGNLKLVEDYLDSLYTTKGLKGKQKLAVSVFKDFYKVKKDLAYVIIKNVIALALKTPETPLLRFSKKLFDSFIMTTKVIQLKETDPNYYSYIENRYKDSKSIMDSNKIKASKDYRIEALEKEEVANYVGILLMDIITKSGCDLIEVFRAEGNALMVKPSSNVISILLMSKNYFLTNNIIYKPMVYPPKDWMELKDTGGYYSYPKVTKFIKAHDKDFDYICYRIQPDLSRLLGVVNKLQKVPFRINKRVLEVINYISDKNLVDPSSTETNPILYGDIPYGDVLNSYDLHPKERFGLLDSNGMFKDKQDYIRWKKVFEDQELRNKRIQSKRLSFSMALQLANIYKEYDRFYYTYQLDFRGRLYPLQQHLNPQGNCVIKSMLEFADGEPLTDEGVYWLKIHGANCYGYDKLSYEDRIRRIDEKEEEIKKIAEDPYTFLKRWNEAKEPLLYLSFCFSYADYLADPTSICVNPVALDATCSGIQIYSGLLKDKKGAMAVNVINGDQDKPNDIYKDVADQVELDLANEEFDKTIDYTTKDKVSHSTSTLIEANSLKGRVTRKLTKRNVMTQPYSVTRLGMVNQLKELLTEYEDNNDIFWKGDKWVVATLLANMNHKAISKVVKGAIIGQSLIKEVLREHLKDHDRALWFTPFFRFPVLQNIKKSKRKRLNSPFGSLVLYSRTKEVHYRKMINGIAPNYIHSLDETLLFRTVELCQEQDKNDFMLIHDSFGMKPNDIPTMNVAVRQAYYELFSSNPLEDWCNQLSPDIIHKIKEGMINDLDLEEVKDSRYIFS